MTHGYLASMTSLDEVWQSRQAELSQQETENRAHIIRSDAYWPPRVSDTVTEMFWDRARLDAAELTGQMLLQGEDVNPRSIATKTVPDSLWKIPGETYTDIFGNTYLRSMIIEWNESMIESMIPIKKEKN